MSTTTTANDKTLQAYRESVGLTTDDLAQLVGMTPAEVTRLEQQSTESESTRTLMGALAEIRADMLDDLHLAMSFEREQRGEGNRPDPNIVWTLPRYQSEQEFAVADEPTAIEHWKTFNMAQLFIGLYLEGLGYTVRYQS
ncbi:MULTISPECIES: helix-turn-helix domain-containing protein [Bifidobacterium]|uniref:Uncharacterized protein n=2 Tax=Bifidobacterium TaxID=1678 RepID=A0A261FNE7_9BIFI|nr:MULTISPECIES: helix-turn-helix transcriptional regulator [Bifidobacterium]OZG60710.1 hypothetical protein BLEM_1679 [Bifidobacterium lemurum]OZG69608.1 hypothetical protein BEUL_0025 [Bifidobacterium eulemuris]QOL32275.1 helix-turn-helix domain-containing protein [Bifidobacterium eulemuris]QOL35235.1 helix-turn-helix domain-containing protein [Bifidobacterium lemurum]